MSVGEHHNKVLADIKADSLLTLMRDKVT